MKKTVISLILVAALTSNAHAFECRLTPAECKVVVGLLVDEINARRYDELASIDRTRAHAIMLIDRHIARLAKLSARLPPRMGEELARLNLCQSEDDNILAGVPNAALTPDCIDP